LAAWKSWQKLIFGKTEQAYYDSFLSEDKNLLKIIIPIVTLWILSYIYLDYVLFITNRGFYILLVERIAFSAISLVSAIYLRRRQTRRNIDLTVLAWSLALAILSFSSAILYPDAILEKLAFHYVLVLSFYLIIPNRIIFKIISATSITLLDIYLIIQALSSSYTSTIFNSIIGITTLIILNAVGTMVALRIERQRYHQYLIQKTLTFGQEKLKAMATTDSLTGILNRRGFFDLAEIEFDRYKRYATGFSFAIIDMDKLKIINDRYGHPAGDLALQTLIEFINQGKRSSDIFGRLAGDEFGLVMPNTKIDAAHHLVDRMHQHITNQEIITPDEDPIIVNFSAGITDAQARDNTFDEIYRRADHALLLAKNKGRNIIEKA